MELSEAQQARLGELVERCVALEEKADLRPGQKMDETQKKALVRLQGFLLAALPESPEGEIQRLSNALIVEKRGGRRLPPPKPYCRVYRTNGTRLGEPKALIATPATVNPEDAVLATIQAEYSGFYGYGIMNALEFRESINGLEVGLRDPVRGTTYWTGNCYSARLHCKVPSGGSL